MKHILVLMLSLFSLSAFAANTAANTAANAKCEDAATYPEISKADLQENIKNKSVYVVDVNGTKSYTKKRIDTAVDFEKIKANLAGALPADKNALIVAYCGGPSCMAWKKAAIQACNMGYTNVKHFKDGIRGW